MSIYQDQTVLKHAASGFAALAYYAARDGLIERRGRYTAWPVALPSGKVGNVLIETDCLFEDEELLADSGGV
jgi:hypothetical protein